MKKYALSIALIFTLFSCGPQKSETPLPRSANGGVDDAGGGNGLNGRPLEEFIDRNFKNRPSYVNGVQPIIDQLKIGFPELAADFVHLTHRRDWYFVPGDLEQIPSQILGAYAKLDQFALQDTKKVWIDDLNFVKMNDHSQSVLIIHELMIGVRLLKHKHKQDLCIANITRLKFEENGEQKYKAEFKKCIETYPFLEGISKDENFKLQKEDYELIRRIVSFLILDPIDFDEVQHLVKDYKLREY